MTSSVGKKIPPDLGSSRKAWHGVLFPADLANAFGFKFGINVHFLLEDEMNKNVCQRQRVHSCPFYQEKQTTHCFTTVTKQQLFMLKFGFNCSHERWRRFGSTRTDRVGFGPVFLTGAIQCVLGRNWS